MNIKPIIVAGSLVLCVSLAAGLSNPALADDDTKNPGYEYYVEGNPGNVTTATTPGMVLMGGSTDVDAAFAWMIQKSGGGDFLVIRATGTDAYNPYIFNDLGGVDSAATLILTKERGAYDPFVIETIRNAEALFIAGGDQWNYVCDWKGTPVEDAIQYVVAKGAPVGGTSAGLAVLGEFVFSAEHDTVTSEQALKNPYQPGVALARDFLHLPGLEETITDSHFVARDRMGRLLVFLARILQDGWAGEARGIGVNEQSALVVEADGTATLLGQGPVYFLKTTQMPEVCKQAKPLTFRSVDVYRLSSPLTTFNLYTWQGAGGAAYSLSVVDGVVESTQSGGGIY